MKSIKHDRIYIHRISKMFYKHLYTQHFELVQVLTFWPLNLLGAKQSVMFTSDSLVLRVVVVYPCSISNVIVIGDFEALLYSKVHAVL